MKILFLCGLFGEKEENYIKKNSIGYYDIAALEFQRKLYEGLKGCFSEIMVLSAPYVGAFPKGFRYPYFKLKSGSCDKQIQYIEFNNIWGIRNLSRTCRLKKAVHDFITVEDEKKYIVIYAPHTPFLAAASYAKKKDRRIKICLIVPDLPQSQYLYPGNSFIYKIAKRLDIKRFDKLNKNMDSYFILTEQMKYKLKTGTRPTVVSPGIITKDMLCFQDIRRENTVVYTGSLRERENVIHIVEAFRKIKDESVKLQICGDGDQAPYIRDIQREDPRIEYLGIVSQKKAREIIRKASVLVSARVNDGEYTKYSFPSKIIEYLASGNPVVAYPLNGMEGDVKNLLICPEDKSITSLQNAIERALYMSDDERDDRRKMCFQYLLENLESETLVKKIIENLEKR